MQEKIDEFSVELVSSLTVLDVGPRGELTKFALGIEKCNITIGGTTKPLLSPGAVVTAAREGPHTVFKIDDNIVDPMTAKALVMAIPAQVPGVTDDDVFGTNERKKIGDTWDINAEVAAKSFKEVFNLSIKKDDIKGASTLDGVVKGGNENFLVVSAWLSMDNFSVPLPDGVKIQTGQAKGVFSGRFPIDQSRQSGGQSMKMIMWFVGNRAADAKAPELIIQGAMEQSVSRETKPWQ